MAAPALNVDKEAVKAHAIRDGIREAARAFGLSEGTVTSWATREHWLAPIAQLVHVAPTPTSMQSRAVIAVSPSQAARNTLERRGVRTKNGISKGLLKAAVSIGRMDGETVLSQAQNVRHVTAAADVIHGWTDKRTPSGPTLNLALFAGLNPDLVVTDVSPSA